MWDETRIPGLGKSMQTLHRKAPNKIRNEDTESWKHLSPICHPMSDWVTCMMSPNQTLIGSVPFAWWQKEQNQSYDGDDHIYYEAVIQHSWVLCTMSCILLSTVQVTLWHKIYKCNMAFTIWMTSNTIWHSTQPTSWRVWCILVLPCQSCQYCIDML